MKLLIPPPVYALLSLTIMWLLADSFPLFSFEISGLNFLAWGLIGLGLSCDIIALMGFLQKKTTINPLHPEETQYLVVEGIYRFSRNPMYLGLLLIQLGVACYLHNYLALIPIIAFVFVVQRFQIIPEEEKLLELFAQDYQNYCAKVGRWL